MSYRRSGRRRYSKKTQFVGGGYAYDEVGRWRKRRWRLISKGGTWRLIEMEGDGREIDLRYDSSSKEKIKRSQVEKLVTEMGFQKIPRSPRGRLKAMVLGTHGKRGQYANQWLVKSRSDPSKTYKVSLTTDGEWQCSCPHWKFRLRKTGGECKHIREVKASLGQPTTTTITPQEFVEGKSKRKVVEVHNTLI